MTTCEGCIGTYNCTISESEVIAAIIEYYIEATDGLNFVTNGTAQNPHIILINLYPETVTLSYPTDITENSMKLSWTESIDTDFENYTIFQSSNKGSLENPIHVITDKSTTSYTIVDLPPASAYYYTIRIYDTGGLYSDSNQVDGRTKAAPALPWVPIIGSVIIAAAIISAIIILRK